MIDTFYVTDLTGQKIENPARLSAIRERLTEVLTGAPTVVCAQGGSRMNPVGAAR